MPSKSTLAVVAVIAYGASVMALPVALNARPDVAAVANPAVNTTSSAVADPSLEQATNGTHPHHHHHHLHHLHALNEDGTPAKHHHRHHHLHRHHHAGAANATVPAAPAAPVDSTTPLDKSATQKLTRREDPPQHHHHHHHHHHKHHHAQAAADPSTAPADPTQGAPADGSGLSARDLTGSTNGTVAVTPTSQQGTPSGTPVATPTPSHKESRKQKWHRQRQEKHERQQKEHERKQKESAAKHMAKLEHEHRKVEAKFLAEQERIKQGHVHGHASRHDVKQKEQELEKLGATHGLPASGLPNSGPHAGYPPVSHLGSAYPPASHLGSAYPGSANPGSLPVHPSLLAPPVLPGGGNTPTRMY
jgi:hypothetical protein